MTAIAEALTRLRAGDALARAGIRPEDPVGAELRAAGLGFSAVSAAGGQAAGLEERWHAALRELRACIRPLGEAGLLLHEGGVYHGAWLESTATIGAEVLDRFAPAVTRATHLALAAGQRADGLLPYKLTADGPAFTQIQTVTPLARGVWHHYLRTGRDRDYLRTMAGAMARNDAWLTAHRDTRGTGGVEAFCTFDTGHDLSPRFWGVPERCHRGDAARFDPGIPGLPFVAPDLTANIVSQREHLALIAEELGDDPVPWRQSAARARAALFAQCHDPDGGMFYDRAADGRPVRVDSDVLLRVLACGIGDDALFAAALEDHLMHTRRFLSAAGFTSIALDDPRFDGDHTRNSWAGPVNALTMLRAPHAFESHGRVAELALAHTGLLQAMAGHDRFAQCFDPWTGDAGYTEVYSPAILWLLDTLERDAGVLPRPGGEIWLSGLIPSRLGHGQAVAASAASRTVAGVRYELAGDDERVEVHRDGARWLCFPRGWRVILDAGGAPASVVCLAAGPVAGDLVVADAAPLTLSLTPNARAGVRGGRVAAITDPGFTPPRSG